MTTTYARTFALLSMLAVDLACVDPEHDAAGRGSFRNNSGGHTLSSGGMWINNVFNEPSVGGIDPMFSLASSSGLATEHGLLLDPDTQDAVRSLVECALPADSSITKLVNGQPITLDGELGLAPEWEDDACDEDCQEWVSACLLARSNHSDHDVSILMRADHPAIGEGTSPLYPTYEASFFGNLFADAQEMHYCRGVASGPLLTQLEERTCAGSQGSSCEIVQHTSCQPQKRCSFPKGNAWGSNSSGSNSSGSSSHSPRNCVNGPITSGHAFHTITTHVGPS